MTPDPYSLDNLRDIVEPASIPWWPPAPGVWLLLGLVAVWLVAGLVLWWVHWRRQAYRRAGLQGVARDCRAPRSRARARRSPGGPGGIAEARSPGSVCARARGGTQR